MSVLPRYPVRRWPLLADIVLILALVVLASVAVSYTHLTLPTICSV